MDHISQWMVADIFSGMIKAAGPTPPSSNSGNSMNGGMFRGALKAKKPTALKAQLPPALARGAPFSKILTSAFTPKNPMKIPNLQQTIRMMNLKANKSNMPGNEGKMMDITRRGLQMRNPFPVFATP